MVTSLQLTSKSTPPDGVFAKSQSRDSETFQGFSFGEILKVKEKQLQQEQGVSASSVAAALAAMQTLPIAANMPDIVTGSEPGKVNEQPAQNAIALDITPVQALAEPLTILAGTNQEQIADETKKFETQASIAAPDVEMLQSSDKPIGKSELPAAIKTSWEKPIQIATPDMGVGDKTRNVPTKTIVHTDTVAPRQPALDMLSVWAGAGQKKIAFDAQQVEAQVSLTAPASKDSELASTAPAALKMSPIDANSQTGEVAARSATQMEVNQARPLQPMVDILPILDGINPGTVETRSSQTMPAVVAPQIKANVTAKVETAAPVTTAQISDGELSISVTDINAGQRFGKVTTQAAFQKEIPASTLDRSIPLAEIPQYLAAAKAMDETTNKSEAGVTQATPLWYSSDTPPAEVETNLEKTVAETKMAGMRIGSGAIVTTDISTGSETEKIVLQPALQTEVTQAKMFQSVPDILPARMGTNQEKTVFEAKQVETQAGADLPVSEVSQSIHQVPVAAMVSSSIRLDNETGNFLTQSTVHAEAANDIPDQPAIDILPAKVETGQKKIASEARQVESQVGKPAPVSDVSQSTIKIPAAAVVSPGLGYGSEAGNIQEQTTAQVEATFSTVVQDSPEILPDQLETESKKTDSNVNRAEIQPSAGMLAIDAPGFEAINVKKAEVPAGGVVQLLQNADMDVGKVSAQTTIQTIKVLPLETAVVGKVEIPVTIEITPDTGIVEPKAIEMQASVNASANAIPQAAVRLVEKALDIPMAEVNPEPSVQNVRAVLTNKLDVVDKLPVPVSSASQKSARAAFASDDLVQTKPSQDAGKTDQIKPADEKTLPADERSEIAYGLESMAATTHPARETLVVKAAERWSTTQVNTQTDVIQQIMHQLNARIQSGPTSMHLQLNPKELGAIDVQMVSSAQGVSVTFYAEQASTGRLLEMQMDQLRQSLTEAGIQLSGLNIGQHGQFSQEGGFLNQNPQFARTSQQAASLNETDIQETLRPERVVGQLGEVDYLI